MTSTEKITSRLNFKLEKVIKSPQELRESDYDGFGSVVVIVNELGQDTRNMSLLSQQLAHCSQMFGQIS